MTYAFRTLDQAKAVREATERVDQWPLSAVGGVNAAMPPVAREAGFGFYDWRVAVETQRRDWETPQMAADRVALWVTLHAELYGRPLTPKAIQGNRIPEPREYTP